MTVFGDWHKFHHWWLRWDFDTVVNRFQIRRAVVEIESLNDVKRLSVFSLRVILRSVTLDGVSGDKKGESNFVGP